MNYAIKYQLMKTALRGMYVSGAHKLLAPVSQGNGMIFVLHHVRPGSPKPFEPTRNLKVTPDFLDQVIRQIRALELDVITLDEAAARLRDPDDHRRFVCFTLDDGYRDNLEHAWPVFQKHQTPFTVYVPTDYASGHGELWWIALEEIIANADIVQVPAIAGGDLAGLTIDCSTTEKKWTAYWRIYHRLRQMSENRQRRVVRTMAQRYGLNLANLCAREIMDWDEIRRMNADPLVTIGGHTAGHYAVGRLGTLRARGEIRAGLDTIEAELGERPRHFAFPYGDTESAGPRDFQITRSLGLATAVTTRKGVLFKEHADHLTALPRVSLNGEFQSTDFTDLFLTGAPFLLANWFRKLDVA